MVKKSETNNLNILVLWITFISKVSQKNQFKMLKLYISTLKIKINVGNRVKILKTNNFNIVDIKIYNYYKVEFNRVNSSSAGIK